MDRVLRAFDAFVLSHVFGTAPLAGDIIHGRKYNPRTSAQRCGGSSEAGCREGDVPFARDINVTTASPELRDIEASPITKRAYNLGLDEFFAWYGQEPRAGFTKATVAAWRVALETRAGSARSRSTFASRPCAEIF